MGKMDIQRRDVKNTLFSHSDQLKSDRWVGLLVDETGLPLCATSLSAPNPKFSFEFGRIFSFLIRILPNLVLKPNRIGNALE